MILLTSVFVLVLLVGVVVGVLTLIWSILMLECISKFRLTMGSIIEWDYLMSISVIYRVRTGFLEADS